MKSSQRPLLLVGAQVLLDALTIAAAFVLVYRWRFAQDIAGRYVPPNVPIAATMLLFLLLPVLLAFRSARLYDLDRGASRVDQAFKIFSALSVGTMIGVALNTLVLRERFAYSTLILAYGWAFSVVLVIVERFLYGEVLAGLRRRGYDARRLLIVGAGEVGQMIMKRVRQFPRLGYRIVGLLDEEQQPGTMVDGVPVLGHPEEIAQVLKREQVDEIIVAMQAPYQRVLDFVARCADFPVQIKVYPDAFQILTRNEITISDLNGLPLATVRNPTLSGFNRFLKRAMDIVFSSIILILGAPFLLLIALLIKLTSPGPALFIQERVGLDGRPFYCIKFRTMIPEAEARTGPVWAAPDDPRVTRLGAFLRRHSIDEIPQFINVLLGDMSIVGPRAERPVFVEQFSQMVPGYSRRHKEKVGITGWAQVNGLRGDSSIEERTSYDLYYVENWSLTFDLKIMVRTIWEMLRGSSY